MDELQIREQLAVEKMITLTDELDEVKQDSESAKQEAKKATEEIQQMREGECVCIRSTVINFLRYYYS